MARPIRAESAVMRTLIEYTFCGAFAALLLLESRPVGAADTVAADCGGPAPAAEVVSTLRAAFEALRTENQDAWTSATTADFFAFDGGARLDGVQLMSAVKSAHAAGKTYEWNVTDPDPHVSCGMAWVAYLNRGSIRDADGRTTSVEWLESAILRYSHGRWHLAFLHSTRVSPKT